MHKKKSRQKRILEKTKPKHVLDACVLFGIFDDDKETREICQKYLGGLGHKFNGFVSIPVLGEIMLKISTKVGDEQLRLKILDYIRILFNEKQLKIITIPKKIECKREDLHRLHRNLPHDDSCHLSHALHHGLRNFVTIDKKLVGEEQTITNKKINEQLRLRIMHPSEPTKELKI